MTHGLDKHGCSMVYQGISELNMAGGRDMDMDYDELETLLEDAVFEGIIECPDCGEHLEPDAPKCWECGKPNPLIIMGMI